MATVTVFVDQAVHGDLPRMCARTGRPTDELAWFERPVGRRSSAMYLLVLLGPVGWLALLALVATERRETLRVRLPYSAEAWRDDRRYGRWAAGSFVGGAAVLLAYGVVGTGPGGGWVVVGAGLILGGMAIAAMRRAQDPDFSMDASRRWVTLTHVHPAFVTATLAFPSTLTRSG